jgi:hypothetical protein
MEADPGIRNSLPTMMIEVSVHSFLQYMILRTFTFKSGIDSRQIFTPAVRINTIMYTPQVTASVSPRGLPNTTAFQPFSPSISAQQSPWTPNAIGMIVFGCLSIMAALFPIWQYWRARRPEGGKYSIFPSSHFRLVSQTPLPAAHSSSTLSSSPRVYISR